MPTTGVRIPQGVIWKQLLNPHSREYKPPEKFPTPHQVVQADFASLRSAGLSTRKTEYSTQFSKLDGMKPADLAKFKTSLSTLRMAVWMQTRFGTHQ